MINRYCLATLPNLIILKLHDLSLCSHFEPERCFERKASICHCFMFPFISFLSIYLYCRLLDMRYCTHSYILFTILHRLFFLFCYSIFLVATFVKPKHYSVLNTRHEIQTNRLFLCTISIHIREFSVYGF